MSRYLKDVRETCPHCEAVSGDACNGLPAGIVHLTRRILSLAREKPDAMPKVKQTLQERAVPPQEEGGTRPKE